MGTEAGRPTVCPGGLALGGEGLWDPSALQCPHSQPGLLLSELLDTEQTAELWPNGHTAG